MVHARDDAWRQLSVVRAGCLAPHCTQSCGSPSRPAGTPRCNSRRGPAPGPCTASTAAACGWGCSPGARRSGRRCARCTQRAAGGGRLVRQGGRQFPGTLSPLGCTAGQSGALEAPAAVAAAPAATAAAAAATTAAAAAAQAAAAAAVGVSLDGKHRALADGLVTQAVVATHHKQLQASQPEGSRIEDNH